jgi:hypothetical protein
VRLILGWRLLVYYIIKLVTAPQNERAYTLGQSPWGFIRVSWTLIMLVWHHIYEERDDKSFMGAERVSWG